MILRVAGIDAVFLHHRIARCSPDLFQNPNLFMNLLIGQATFQASFHHPWAAGKAQVTSGRYNQHFLMIAFASDNSPSNRAVIFAAHLCSWHRFIFLLDLL